MQELSEKLRDQAQNTEFHVATGEDEKKKACLLLMNWSNVTTKILEHLIMQRIPLSLRKSSSQDAKYVR